MNKYFSSLVLAVIGTFTIGTQVLAAPGVVYKKQLNVPVISTGTMNQLKELARKSSKPSKESLTKPKIVQELDCTGVMYRLWNTQNTKNDKSIEQYHIIEARSDKSVKWHILKNPDTGFNTSKPKLSACHGSDLILFENGIFQDGYVRVHFRAIAFSAFEKDSTWTSDKNIQSVNHSALMTVDGIKQMPGTLTVMNGKISGDSRPLTFDQKEAFHLHTLPHYRDLTKVSADTDMLLFFFRMQDGYALIEYSLEDRNNSNKEMPYTVHFYRIRNGEARYSEVSNLPILNSFIVPNEEKINFELVYVDYGKDIKSMDIFSEPKTTFIPVHGLPPEGYSTNANIVWETDAQVYTRYMITNVRTGAQQYWEATVNKN